MPGKKRNKQNRIDKKGQKIFDDSLPDESEFSMVYSKENGEDFGIDGQIQIFKNETHTGEFLKVQLKSKDIGNYINDGKTLSLSIDLDSAYFLIDQVQDPTALIVVDTKSNKVFWHPIQTDSASRIALEEKLDSLNNKVKDPHITIHIDTTNIRSPTNYQSLYDYLQKAKIWLSQKSILKTKTSSTLSEGLKYLQEVESEILNLPVFDWYTTGSDSYLSIANRLRKDYPTQFPVLKTARRKVENMLKNPYYHGEREYKGKVYPHRFETIIPKEVFELATEKRTGRARVKDKQKKVTKSIYGGLLPNNITNSVKTGLSKKKNMKPNWQELARQIKSTILLHLTYWNWHLEVMNYF